MAVDVNQLYSTYKTFLMHGTTSGGTTTYEKLIDIRSFPDMGGSPDLIDCTTLSNKSKIGVPGIQNNDALVFEANYNPTTYAAVKAVCDGLVHDFSVWFGGTESGNTLTPDGSDGKFDFKGMADVYVAGGGVNEARTIQITITPTTDIAFSVPS